MSVVIMDRGAPERLELVTDITAARIASVTGSVAERFMAEYNETSGIDHGQVHRYYHPSFPGNDATVAGSSSVAPPAGLADIDNETVMVTSAIFKSAVVLLLSLVVTVSNSLVIHVIRLDRTLHTVGNLFTASLAIADLFVGIIVIPLNVFDVLAVNRWQDHHNAGRGIWVTLDFFFTTSSIMNLVLLNLDRFWSITSPIKYIRQRTRRRATMLIAGVWGVPVMFIFGPATAWKLAFANVAVPSRTVFVSYYAGSWLMAAGAAIIYIIPLVILCAIYSQIYRAIHRRSKMEVGRSSIASSVMSTRPGSSRRDSESQHNFITEHELQRLKGIYEKTVRRERGERQLMAMIRRRSRGYSTGAREIQRYASIDEEDHDMHCDGEAHLQEGGQCDKDGQDGSVFVGVHESSLPSSDGKLADAESNDMDHDEDSFDCSAGEHDALMTHEADDEDDDGNQRKPILSSMVRDEDLDRSPRSRIRRKDDSASSTPNRHPSPRSLKPDRLQCDLFSNGMVLCPNCSPSSRGSSRGSSPNRKADANTDDTTDNNNYYNKSPVKTPDPSHATTPEKREIIDPDTMGVKTLTDQNKPLLSNETTPHGNALPNGTAKHCNPLPNGTAISYNSLPNGSAVHCNPLPNGTAVHPNGIMKRPPSLVAMQESSFTTSSEINEMSPREDVSTSPTDSEHVILSDADSETGLQKPTKHKTSFTFDLINEVTHCRCKSDSINQFRQKSRSLSFPKCDHVAPLQLPVNGVPLNGFRGRVRKSLTTSFSALSGRGSKALMLLRKQDKAAKQLGIILTCLIVCWTPYFFQVLLYSFAPEISNTTAMTIAVYLGYSHSFLNPVLYALFNLRFQRAFRNVLCSCCNANTERSPRPCSVPPSLI